MSLAVFQLARKGFLEICRQCFKKEEKEFPDEEFLGIIIDYIERELPSIVLTNDAKEELVYQIKQTLFY